MNSMNPSIEYTEISGKKHINKNSEITNIKINHIYINMTFGAI